MAKVSKGDFIEVEYTGRLKEEKLVFDTTDEAIAKESGIHSPNMNYGSVIICLGEGQLIQGLEEDLEGKETENEYTIELSPEKAFGSRNSKLIQMIPIKIFKEHKINPVAGAMFNFDGKIAKILAVSGGRTIVDFNNPLAGKTVIYDIKVLRKIEDLNKKTKALIEFFTKKDFKFEIKDKKLTIHADKQFTQFLNLFKDKFKDILDLELEVKEIKDKSQ